MMTRIHCSHEVTAPVMTVHHTDNDDDDDDDV